MPTLWPWPDKDWYYNSLPLDCIIAVAYMDRLLRKDKNKWTEADDKFYLAVHEDSDADTTAI